MVAESVDSVGPRLVSLPASQFLAFHNTKLCLRKSIRYAGAIYCGPGPASRARRVAFELIMLAFATSITRCHSCCDCIERIYSSVFASSRFRCQACRVCEPNVSELQIRLMRHVDTSAVPRPVRIVNCRDITHALFACVAFSFHKRTILMLWQPLHSVLNPGHACRMHAKTTALFCVIYVVI